MTHRREQQLPPRDSPPYLAEGGGTDIGERRRSSDNDPPALTAQSLWISHRRWVAAILLAHKPAWADLDDLLQDVAVSVVRTVKDLRDPRSVKPWLRTIAINAAAAAGRSGSLRRRTVGSLDATNSLGTESTIVRLGTAGPEIPPEGRASRDTGHEGQSEARRVTALLRELPEGYREPLVLKAVRGMSYREIGVVMGLPETTVETRIARARKMLRELAQRPGTSPGTSREAGMPAPGAARGR